jgi:uncharacterized protein with HEPN domain
MSQHDDDVRLRHMLDAARQAIAYFDVDLDRLWQVVAADLPPLALAIEAVLGQP